MSGAVADHGGAQERLTVAADERLQLLIEQIKDYAIFLLDPSGNVATWNTGAQRIKGYSAEDIIGRHFSVFYRPQDVWKCEQELAVATRDGSVEDEGIRVRKDGTEFWANVVITCIRDAGGAVVGFAKVTRDMTERRRAQEALRENEERFRLLVDSVRDYAIFRLDPDGRVATWNAGAERIKGYQAREIIGVHFSRFYPESDVRAGKCEMELEVAAREGRFEDEGWRIRKDGSPFWANVVITALRNAQGELVGYAKVTRDLSERRAAEIERQRLGLLARERVHALAGVAEMLAVATSVEEIASVVAERGRAYAHADTSTVHLLDDDGVLELVAQRGCNPALLPQISRITSASGNPLYAVGTTPPSAGKAGGVWIESREQYAQFFPALASSQVEGPRAQAFACLPLVAGEHTVGMVGLGYHEPHPFGDNEVEFVWALVRQCAQAIARVRALDAQRRAAGRASRLSASLSTTLRSIGDAVIATNPQGEITLLNAVAEALTGFSEAEAVGKPLPEVFRIVNEHTRQAVQNPVEKVLETGGIIGLANHTVLLSRDGREIPIDDSGAPIRTSDQHIDGVVLVFRDVSERKREESRQVFQADATTLLAESIDYAATLRKVAELAVPELADWCAVDLLNDGNPIPERVAVAHANPDKVKLARDLHAKYPPDPNATRGISAVVRSGDPELYPLITDEMLVAGCVDAEHLSLARSLQLHSAMVVPLVVGGKTLGALTFVFAESGRVYDGGYLALAQELAHRCANAIQNARLFRSEQEARRSAAVANRAKDEFLAMVSHELRTPLNAIMGWSKVLANPHFDDNRRAGAMATIERNAVAMAQLIEDLLDMSRVITGKMRLSLQRVDVAQVTETAVQSLAPQAQARGVQLGMETDPELPGVVGDPTRLQQIIWNLVSNAVKFTPQGGSVHIGLRRADGALEIVVRDTGKGIAADFLPRVFDAFRQEEVTASRSRGGLGLGLAITRQLVELHGGTIAVSSSGEGQGATFTVRLPVSSSTPSSQPSGSEHPRQFRTEMSYERPPQLNGLKVLVVDDDDDARSLTASILEDCGCLVSRAGSGREALEQLRQSPPDVLLSDVAMPEMDGIDLVRKIRQLPREQGGDIPAAALTAYARAEDRLRLLNAGFSIHLPKPIEPAELVAVVLTLTRFIHRVGD